ncbi:MAG TPA: trypsin-like peptidase domain-containing protein [Actinomycetota bacterium]|nr:trypsin-like peptidase domain-containing protein [Actinomycetota bacterium]
MSTRDGLEPSRSPDSESHTQPIPGDPQDSAQPQQDPWPPSWGQAPSPAGQPPAAPAEGPGWTPPAAAQGPSWTQAKSPEAPPPPAAEGPDDQTRPAWGQDGEGGGGHPTVPGWGVPPAGAGSPGGRRPSRWLAAVAAGVVLLASGYGISQALDDDAPAGAGIPTAAAPVAAAPVQSGEEPAAAVAKALLPTVVEIRHDNGLGSGFVYDANGFIMTAAHVVEGVDQVDVRLFDGTKLQGKVLGTDQINDVAVIKVDRTGLKAAPLGVGQDLQVGQLAVAIGSPFGLNETVTAGIISSTDRLLEGREVIQTDAPINPGNSGGVLADRNGRVIGINDAIRPGANSNGNVGIGFAVPIDIAAKSAAAIVKGEQVQIGYLGVTPSLTTTGGRDGALIQEVAPDSPAAKAGIRPGDLVVTVDGKAIENYSEMVAAIRAHKPGDQVTLRVVRGGSETAITATLAQRPAG